MTGVFYVQTQINMLLLLKKIILFQDDFHKSVFKVKNKFEVKFSEDLENTKS